MTSHLASLFASAESALRDGEGLCAWAQSSNTTSANTAVNILALDAKVRWIGEAVLQQLKLAANVAKAIEEKRAHLDRQVQEWDALRTKHTDALDSVLESLETHHVPPDFYETSADSSIFGSQVSSPSKGRHTEDPHNNQNGHANGTSPEVPNGGPHSPSATMIRSTRSNGTTRADQRRPHWRTLRDFVDDQAVERSLEDIEVDRAHVDDIIAKTDTYPEHLSQTIRRIQTNLPPSVFEPVDSSGTTPMLSFVQDAISEQVKIAVDMAHALESLATHYGEMSTAFEESQDPEGEEFTKEDIQAMERDAAILPTVISDLEHNARQIENHAHRLQETHEGLQKDFKYLTQVLDDLDQLGDIMSEMLETQETVDAEATEAIHNLHHHLSTLDQFHEHFCSYRTAFNRLLLEIARRKQSRLATENDIKRTIQHLKNLTQDEINLRASFNAEYGKYLPEDLCLCIGNAPTEWEIVPVVGSSPDVLPDLAEDLVQAARERLAVTSGTGGVDGLPSAESI